MTAVTLLLVAILVGGWISAWIKISALESSLAELRKTVAGSQVNLHPTIETKHLGSRLDIDEEMDAAGLELGDNMKRTRPAALKLWTENFDWDDDDDVPRVRIYAHDEEAAIVFTDSYANPRVIIGWGEMEGGFIQLLDEIGEPVWGSRIDRAVPIDFGDRVDRA